MIKNIIFDFGDVFINLDKNATKVHLAALGHYQITPELESLAIQYEKGLITTSFFLNEAEKLLPNTLQSQLIQAWNAIILDFPDHRLSFIKDLVNHANYRLFLLSNTNELHIQKVVEHMGTKNYLAFKACFEAFYLSHEIHLRKPEPEIFKMILESHALKAEETLFIDDTKEHIEAAKNLGITTWHLKVNEEDIVELKSKL
jgi:putative hydrolase of the HAD superfamily